jgi:WD40 repeat protein
MTVSPASTAKPVILLAFANDPADGINYLRNLSEEARQLRAAVEYAEAQGLCEYALLYNATLDDILAAFQNPKYKGRIAVFHYGGHAESYELLFQSRENELQRVDGRGFAAFLAEQRGLQLVFLNACTTEPQVEGLLAANVQVVITTAQEVDDGVAAGLAAAFYGHLARGDSIGSAYRQAVAAQRAQRGDDPGLFYVPGGGPPPDASAAPGGMEVGGSTSGGFWPWLLRTRRGAEAAVEWSLPLAAGDPLFGLPALPRKPLPDSPYQRGLDYYTRDLAELFFGRSREIRDLYQRVTAAGRSRVILYYGQSGVGKSSLLDAGLAPRLEVSHAVVYVRRDRSLGLLGTLRRQLAVTVEGAGGAAGATAAGLPPGTSLAAAWLAAERQLDRPIVLILDQVEEAFTRRNPDLPQELDEFAAALSSLDAVSPPVGKPPTAGTSPPAAATLPTAISSGDPAGKPAGVLLLGFRKERLAELETALRDERIDFAKVYLAPLGVQGIEDVFWGPVRNPELAAKYGLTVEDELPQLVARDLTADPDSPVAPTLNILLRKLWAVAKAESASTPHFTSELYAQLRREGILLDDFLRQQRNTLAQEQPQAVASGLLLDLWAFHTTPLGTADQREEEEVRAAYGHLPDWEALVTRSKDLYVLADPPGDNPAPGTRLAHDTLAPLVRRDYDQSTLPGQQARRILESRAIDWQAGSTGARLDDAALAIVHKGLAGTRHLTDDERRLLEASRLDQARRRQQQRTWRRLGIVAIATILALVVAAFVLGNNQRVAQYEREDALAQALLAAERVERSNVEATTAALIAQATLTAEREAAERLAAAAEASQKEAMAAAAAAEASRLAEEQAARAAAAETLAAAAQSRMQRGKLYDDLTMLLARDAVLTTWNSPDHMVLPSAEAALQAALDGATWRMTLPSAQERHVGVARYVEFDPRGGLLASAGDDGTIRLWTVPRLKAVRTLLGHVGWVMSVDFSPDGVQLVSAGADNTLRLWDTDNGEQIYATDVFSGITSAVFSPDGTMIAGGDYEGGISFWRADSGELVRTLHVHSETIDAISFGPDGSQIVSGGRDNLVKVTDVASGRVLHSFSGHTGDVSSVDFNSDGSRVASAGDDSMVRIWELASNRMVLETTADDWHASTVKFLKNPDHIFEVGWHWGAGITVPRSGALVVDFDQQQDMIYAGAVSADESYAATVNSNGLVQLWSVTTGESWIGGPGHTDFVNAIAFAPDSRTLLSVGDDGTARLWDLETGKEIGVLRGHEGRVTAAAFSLTGGRVVTGDENGSVRLWDIVTGKQEASYESYQGDILSLDFSPDGNAVLISGKNDDLRSCVQIWTIGPSEGKSYISTIPVFLSYCHTSARFAPHGNSVAILVPYDLELRENDAVELIRKSNLELWDPVQGVRTSIIRGNEVIVAARFSGDSNRVIVGYEGGVIQTYDLKTGAILQTIEGPEWLMDLALNPDESLLAATYSGGRVRVWNLRTGVLQQELESAVVPTFVVAFSPNGALLAGAGGDANQIVVWDLNSSGDQRVIESGSMLDEAAFSPDGQLIGGIDIKARTYVFQAGTHKALHTLEGQFRGAGLAFSADSRVLATVGGDYLNPAHEQTVRLWDVRTGRQLLQLEGMTSGFSDAAFSPDGKVIATAGDDGNVVLWPVDIGAGAPLAPSSLSLGDSLSIIAAHDGGATSVSYSPDGVLLASAGRDGLVRLWNVETAQPIANLADHAMLVNDVAFSPDGAFLASAGEDGGIQIWDVRTHEPVRLLAGHRGAVNSMAFAPDGKTIASASSDNSARTWDVGTGASLRTVVGHVGDVVAVSYSPDGHTLLTAGIDGTIRLWPASIELLLAAVEERIERPVHALTGDERRVLGVSSHTSRND